MSDTAAEGAAAGRFRHPFDPAVWPEPSGAYRQLRDEWPLFPDRVSELTLVSRYSDCVALLRNRSASVAAAQRLRAREAPLPPSMLNTDPPEHDGLRTPAMSLLGPQAAMALDAQLATAVAEVLDEVARSGEVVDGVASIAIPFATGVLGTLLAVPQGDRPTFARLARDASVNLDPMASPERLAGAAQATEDLDAFLRRHARNTQPHTPLGTFWNDATGTETARAATLMLVAVGGFEPLVNLAAMGAHALAGKPDIARAVARDREAAGAFVDELLRLGSPIPFVARHAAAAIDLPTATLAAGTNALALLGSANLDEHVFTCPDELRLDRRPNPHLAFGAGTHYCPGAPLVRSSAGLLFSEIARRFPNLTRAGPPAKLRMRRSLVPRGPVFVPLAPGPPSRAS